ncbi:MAG: 4-hydroxyphenylacetate 3-monooxygenase, reductase component [Porticoccaceae bacterium]
MPISAQLFRDAMANLAAAVTVVTTNGPAGKNGLTASAVCSVSDTPPIVLVCVNHDSQANQAIKANGKVCINICNTGQEEICRHFAGMTDLSMDARFGLDCWDNGELDTPLLRGAIANLEGRVVDCKEVATHSVFFIQLENIIVDINQPALTYYARAFKSLSP